MANLKINGDLALTGGGGVLTLNGVNIFDKIYPVGSIYMSVNNINPGTLFGGTWEKISGGYALFTVNGTNNNDSDNNPANHTPGQPILGGLPNIRGDFAANRLGIYEDIYWDATENSPFYISGCNTRNGQCGANNDPERHAFRLGFDARQSSVVYGSWQTAPTGNVIPDHIGIVAWKRIA